jgi:hypothetical protein
MVIIFFGPKKKSGLAVIPTAYPPSTLKLGLNFSVASDALFLVLSLIIVYGILVFLDERKH